jgi:hypothetical protein
MCYASIEPDQIDPSLGTPEQFKHLIDAAHARGIKIFLDVTTHGLMKESSIVRDHPRWFRGGTWGMVDFDWNGGHTDLDNWWVRVWSDYVSRYGVDGFRLDTNIYRPDLWVRVRENAATAGHPIVIFEEGDTGGVIPGVTDFVEAEDMIFAPSPDAEGGTPRLGEPNAILANDIPGFYDRKFGRTGRYKVEIEYEDGVRAEGHTGQPGALRVSLDGLRGDRVSRRLGDRTGFSQLPNAMGASAPGVPTADGLPDVQLTVEGVSDKPIRNILVSDDYQLAGWFNTGWGLTGSDRRPLAMNGHAPVIRLYLSTVSYNSSIALSIHDLGLGREYPENPYTARASRALFGYSFLGSSSNSVGRSWSFSAQS